MSLNNRIEISASKVKSALPADFLLTNGITGLLEAINPGMLADVNENHDKTRIFAAAAAAIGFGLSISVFWKMFKKNSGLIIDQTGITDYSNATYTGLIEWADVTGIKKIKNGPLKSILIQTDKPEKYLNQGRKVMRSTMAKAYRIHGSPLLIVSSRLKIKYDVLLMVITQEYQKSKGISN